MKMRGAGAKAGALVLVAMLAVGMALLPVVAAAANGDSYYGEKRLQSVGAQSAAITDAAAATAAAITDNSTGTASQTVAAGAGVHTIAIDLPAAAITGNVDVLTTYTPGYKFKILAFDARVTQAITTGAKAATLNLEIGTTNVTGGEIALAGTYALGAAQAGAAITAANTGAANASISIEASGVTAFSEGHLCLLITIQNMDTADAIASIIDDANKQVTDVGLVRTALNSVITALERAWIVAD